LRLRRVNLFRDGLVGRKIKATRWRNARIAVARGCAWRHVADPLRAVTSSALRCSGSTASEALDSALLVAARRAGV